MCGIAGLLRFGGEPIAPGIAGSLLRELAHRGPDGSGVHRDPAGDLVLVHNRLAIIDLSPGGAQPQGDGRYWITFNGEIYNYRELRRELEADGERLATGSDTEVLRRLVARRGVEGIARLRGMFAFALWDSRERSLLLSRDRFGIKPLYLHRTPSSVAFASEAQALVGAGLAPPEPAPEGILSYLLWGSIPSPRTHVRGVDALAPGSWLEVHADGRVREGRFADARQAYVTAEAAEGRELEARVAAEVEASVGAHLVADVPVALFLSGGIDSSAIVSAAASLGRHNVEAVTVTFDEGPGAEEEHAREVARHFGLSHHVVKVSAGDVASELGAIVARMDLPTLDGINSYLVSRAVSALGIKAVLSGTGGDELFGGYPTFRRIPRALASTRPFPRLSRALGPAAGVALPRWRRAKWRHLVEHPGSPVAAYRSLRGLFMPEELDGLLGAAPGAPPGILLRSALEEDERRLSAVGVERPVATVARLETSGYLASQLLRDMDVMAMAHGLEVRVPFVDAELQRTVWPGAGSAPECLTNKRLLHGTLKQPLPRRVHDRPKQGFALPFAQWMTSGELEAVRLGIGKVEAEGWLAQGSAVAIWEEWRRGHSHWSRPWSVGILGLVLGHLELLGQRGARSRAEGALDEQPSSRLPT